MTVIAMFCLWALAGCLGSHLAIRLGVKDVPNDRSSHTKITPRGGGIAFIGLGLVGVMGLAYATLGSAGTLVVCGYVVAVLLIAVTGLVDDIYGLSARFRFGVQFLSVVMMVGLSWQFMGLSDLPVLVLAVACVAGVWVINAFNFMDGIDGIAGVQALFVLGMGAWAFASADQMFLALTCLSFAAPVIGFLVTNLPPAKIFMGDVGSGALGAVFALLIVASVMVAPQASAVLCIALAPFLVDATLTLIRRLLRGERPSEAHREHLYQRMTQHFGDHRKTLLVWTLGNVATCVPVSALVIVQAIGPITGVVTIYVVLSAIHSWAAQRLPSRQGSADSQSTRQ